MTHGERAAAIRAARVDRGLTQLEAADELGVAKRTYQRWESGQTTPRHAHLVALAELLQISLADIDGIDG